MRSIFITFLIGVLGLGCLTLARFKSQMVMTTQPVIELVIYKVKVSHVDSLDLIVKTVSEKAKTWDGFII